MMSGIPRLLIFQGSVRIDVLSPQMNASEALSEMIELFRLLGANRLEQIHGFDPW